MSTPVIATCQKVSRHFGGLLANRDVSLEVRTGEILGLIGPNGAGKSTLFNLIAGSIAVSSGRIEFGGQDITSLSATARCRAGIARTFQVPRSFDSMSVLDNVVVGALVRHPRLAAAREKAYEVLVSVELEKRAGASAGLLTPPEKRRLEIARALASEPKLLLLDEALTGLTPSEARNGVELFRRIRDAGVSLVMVEHVMEIVMPLVDRVVVLNLGEILAEGRPQDVVRDPSVIAAYLGERHNVA